MGQSTRGYLPKPPNPFTGTEHLLNPANTTIPAKCSVLAQMRNVQRFGEIIDTLLCLR